MSTSTIVITLPRHLKGPATTTTAHMVPAALSPLLPRDLLQQVVKEEPPEAGTSPGGEKPPRKRQRLDHLSQEEKIMRRKLKNRVAAQTARDRKKLRMDQLETQISDLNEHVSELTNLASILSNKNDELLKQNEALQEKLSQCTCSRPIQTKPQRLSQNTTSGQEPQSYRVEGAVIPVTVPTDGSAVSAPQQRAAGTLAVIRIMTLSTLCSQWATQALVALALNWMLIQPSVSRDISTMKFPQHPLPVKKRPMCGKWWGPQQQSWNPPGI